jgi:hypothetical protein
MNDVLQYVAWANQYPNQMSLFIRYTDPRINNSNEQQLITAVRQIMNKHIAGLYYTVEVQQQTPRTTPNLTPPRGTITTDSPNNVKSTPEGSSSSGALAPADLGANNEAAAGNNNSATTTGAPAATINEEAAGNNNNSATTTGAPAEAEFFSYFNSNIDNFVSNFASVEHFNGTTTNSPPEASNGTTTNTPPEASNETTNETQFNASPARFALIVNMNRFEYAVLEGLGKSDGIKTRITKKINSILSSNNNRNRTTNPPGALSNGGLDTTNQPGSSVDPI